MLAALPLKAYRHPARIRPPEIAGELLPALWTSLDAYLAIAYASWRFDRGARFRYRTRIRRHYQWSIFLAQNTPTILLFGFERRARCPSTVRSLPAASGHLAVAVWMKNGSPYPGFYVPVTPLTSIPWVAFIVERRMWVRWEFGAESLSTPTSFYESIGSIVN